MQSNSMGVDRILSAGRVLDDVVITNARGVYDDELAEHALSLVLALVRELHHIRDDQHKQRWARRSLRTVNGMNVLVLGWGGIGQGIARRLNALGAQVHGVRRSHSGAPTFVSPRVSVGGIDTWRSMLPTTNILMLALPLTLETYRMVGSDELAALPQGSFVVNVGRGETLDETALLDAVHAGHVCGAALDVMEHEPLPPDNPLWHEPNVLITPHLGRSLEQTPFRWESLFVENLRRYASGEPLLNVVDQERGY
jgi:phosphoglycerate dehydrogenase-like enzyme